MHIEAVLGQLMDRISTLGASQPYPATSNSAPVPQTSQNTQNAPQNAPTTPAPPSTPPTSSTTSQSHKPAKPAVPFAFNGDRTLGKAFLAACYRYIASVPSQFPSDHHKINWVLSYMSVDQAALWATDQTYALIDGTTSLKTWSDFEIAFKERFTVPDDDAIARNILNSTSYHQNNRSLDQYIDSFDSLLKRSMYTDSFAIVEMFRRGLKRTLATRVATSADRPLDTDLDGWKTKARLFDRNDRENSAFYHQTPITAPTRSTAAPQPSHSFSKPLPPPAPKPLPMGVPMDIDASKSSASSQRSLACYRCGSLDHLARSCPKRFDIRYMSQEDIDEYHNQLALDRDATEIEEKSEKKEDF